jgi:hypothetical protein
VTEEWHVCLDWKRLALANDGCMGGCFELQPPNYLITAQIGSSFDMSYQPASPSSTPRQPFASKMTTHSLPATVSYKVYKTISLGAPRNHHAIFVEMKAVGRGNVLQVTGNIHNGMVFEAKQDVCPRDSTEFIGQHLLGWVPVDGYAAMEELCRNHPPPKKQFDGPRRLFPKEPLRRCQEWTKEACEALVSGGILLTEADVVSEA